MPEGPVARGQPEQVTIVAVPETAVNEDHGAVFVKDDIRLAGQGFDVEAVTETLR